MTQPICHGRYHLVPESHATTGRTAGVKGLPMNAISLTGIQGFTRSRQTAKVAGTPQKFHHQGGRTIWLVWGA